MPPARIVAQFRKEYFHRWVDAPERHAYLRNNHRHLLHVRVELEVQQDDREIEFIEFGRDLAKVFDLCVDGTIHAHIPERADQLADDVHSGNASCEEVARLLWIISAYYLTDGECSRWVRVEVLEDGENGAVVEGVFGQ